MNIYQFLDEEENLSLDRRKRFVFSLVEYIMNNENRFAENNPLIEFLMACESLEQDDMFGTEGFHG